MAQEIKMPRLSQTTDEVRLISWLVQEGDFISKGDPICEVETDKVTMNVESFESGTVLRLVAKPDSVVDAGTVIAILGKPGEDQQVRHPDKKKDIVPVTTQRGRSGISAASTLLPSIGEEDGVRATRLVRNIAMKRNIDLMKVSGTGPRGMITKEDLELYIETTGKAKPEDVLAESVHAGKAGEATGAGMVAPGGEIALTDHQGMVAGSLTKSKREIPHYYLKSEIVTDGIIRWREKNLDSEGSKVSVDSFFIYAAARALKGMPKLNGYFRDNTLVLFNRIHIAFAVAHGDELYAPVVRDADQRSIKEIDCEIKRLSLKVQSGKIERSDFSGGSFTITNLGMFPVSEFCAIINPPQPGILAIGRMKKSLVIEANDTMIIKTICTVTGSFDHRVVNGMQGAAFLQKLKEIVEGI